MRNFIAMSNRIIEEKVQHASEILNNLGIFNNQTILSRDILISAAICKIYDELAFADFRAKLKLHRNVTLTLFNEALAKYIREVKKEFAQFERNSKIININAASDNIYALPELPNGLQLNIPPTYTCSTRGIVIDKVTPNGKHKTKFVAYAPFFVIERLKNIDDQTERYKVAIYTPSGWDFITADRYDFSEEHRLVTLSRYGLGVDSVIARDTVTYVSELVRYNIDVIPTTKIVNRIGWRNNFSEFIYPPHGENYIVNTGDNDEMKLIYTVKGSRQEWLNHYDKIKHYRHARLAFNAALAAAFVEIINVRNMTLCIWGKSGGGKTAGIIKFPMSIYGDPRYVPTFNSTFNSLERRAVNSNNLPFAVDELQNITSKFQRDNIDKFAHIIGEGVSKGRTAKNGDLEPLSRFSTIALITGEQPLTNFSSDQGKKRRTVEFHCREVLPRSLAEETHHFVSEHFGLIGRDWVEFIKNHIEEIKTFYHCLQKDFKVRKPEAMADHLNFTAAAYAADILFNVYFCEINIHDVFAELYNGRHIHSILDELPSEIESNSAECAKEFIREFIHSRRKHFLHDGEILAMDPIFGCINESENKVIFYPHQLKNELQKAGYSPEKIINELIAENFFIRDAQGYLAMKNINK